MTRRRSGVVIVLVSVVVWSVAACSGGETASTPSSTTATDAPTVDTSSTSRPPTYSGDPGSPFCVALAEGGSRPVLDPFEAGIEGRERELRMRALRLRFEELVEVTPPELADDVGLVADGLAALDDALAAHGHDLVAAAEAGVDLSFADAPEFAAVSARIAAYRSQVCRP